MLDLDSLDRKAQQILMYYYFI